MRPLTIALLLSLAAIGAKQRNWQTGTLEATAIMGGVTPGTPVAIANSSVIHGGGVGAGADAAMAAAASAASEAQAISASRPTQIQMRGYRITGNGYRYDVALQTDDRPTIGKVLHGIRVPNVTVHGPIKYALEKGIFYIQDEDGREFRLMVIEKVLLVPGPPAPSVNSPARP